MQVLVDTLHILERNSLPKHHLVEGTDEERVKESPMEDGQAHHATNKFEVIQMLRVHTRVRVDLQGIIIVGGVFEETVEGVKHFMRKEEEEFTIPVSIRFDGKGSSTEAYRESPP